MTIKIFDNIKYSHTFFFIFVRVVRFISIYASVVLFPPTFARVLPWHRTCEPFFLSRQKKDGRQKKNSCWSALTIVHAHVGIHHMWGRRGERSQRSAAAEREIALQQPLCVCPLPLKSFSKVVIAKPKK